MSERPLAFDRGSMEPEFDDLSGGNGAHDARPEPDEPHEQDAPQEPVSLLRETLAHWSAPAKEEEPSEEEQLAAFLDALGKSDHTSHQAANSNSSNQVGRRSAPRLRLSLPARFQSIEDTHKAILLNISRSGAQFAILKTVREGEGGMLECGPINVFAIVTRAEFSINAVEFEEPLSEAEVLDIRRFYENFEERERRALIETARQWVTGDSKDERAI